MTLVFAIWDGVIGMYLELQEGLHHLADRQLAALLRDLPPIKDATDQSLTATKPKITIKMQPINIEF